MRMTRRGLLAASAGLLSPKVAAAQPSRLPRASDTIVSIRSASSPRQEALDAYRPDRIEWVYSTDPPVFAALRAESGAGFISGAINANAPIDDPAGYARDFDGKIIVAPWMTWGAKWVTTASPVTRAAVADWGARTLKAGADGLQVDDGMFQWASDAWGAGDFSEASLAGFGPWLARNVSPGELTRIGLRAGSSFDYREWLRSHGVNSAKDYKAKRAQLPSTRLWARYLGSEVRSFWKTLRPQVGGPISVNFGRVEPSDGVTGLSDLVDYTVSELSMKDDPWRSSLYSATAEAVGLPFAGCFSGRAPPVHIRRMIATAYANGINPVAPWDIFVPSENGVTQARYSPGPSHFEDLYAFVRRNRRLFDGWSRSGDLGVAVPVRRYNAAAVLGLVHRLWALNVAFRLIVVDSDLRRLRIDLTGLSDVVLAQPAADYGAATLAALEPRRTDISDDLLRRHSVGMAGDWRLVERRRNETTLLHLVPSRWDGEPFTGSVSWRGLGAEATLHRPGQAAITLSTDGGQITLPETTDWAIIEPTPPRGVA